MKLESLRGYLLEEVLAHLLRNSGYELLRSELDPTELVSRSNGLNVRGRGADHQADVLGQLSWTPAFSRPIRLFVEAKFRQKHTGVEELREAVGILQDLNTRYTRDDHSSPMVKRYSYRYALFSTSGFSRPAADYALAHELSVIDLRVGAFDTLVQAIRATAPHINEVMPDGRQPGISPGAALRATLRTAFEHELARSGTALAHSRAVRLGDDHLADRVLDSIPDETRGRLSAHHISPLLRACRPLVEHVAREEPLIIGMPEAPYFLALRPDSWSDFASYVRTHGDHRVNAGAHISDDRVIIHLRPEAAAKAYQLRFSLPTELEKYVLGGDDVSERMRQVKREVLAHITATIRDGDQDRMVRLFYTPRVRR